MKFRQLPKLLEMIRVGRSHFPRCIALSAKTAQSIIDKGGDYVIAVKRNQPNLAESVLDAFIAAEESEKAAKSTGLRTKVDKSCNKSAEKPITRTTR
ncbi:MAG: hypothetical protein R3C03_20870 [Pirellulaceae bacterium]